MSKTRVVEILEQNGDFYGQVSSPADITKSQEYANVS